jgi:CRISPR type III-B/RAMP module RAMP protein Cmr6
VIRELPNIRAEFVLENDLGEKLDQQLTDKRTQFVDFLERELFDGEKPERNEDGTLLKKDEKIIYKQLGVYERDIFFDAYLVAAQHPAINRMSYQNSKPFIGDDYITPHINRKKPELSPFTNPVPLMFLKILPEVTIQFQFDLKDGLLTKEQKQELFRRLLLDFGIGAKTNVGYGQFNEDTVSSLNNKRAPMSLNLPDDQIPDNTIPLLKQNASFSGEMIDQIGEYNLYQFTVGREVCKVKKRKDKNPTLQEGDKVTILIKLDYKKGATLAFQVK